MPLNEQVESLREFINELKREDNETFLENVVLKGLEACFEVTTLTNDDVMGDDGVPASVQTEEDITEIEDNAAEDVEDYQNLADSQRETEALTVNIAEKADEREQQDELENGQ